MAKYVCENECFVTNIDGRRQHFLRGDVAEFKKAPTHFRPLKGPKSTAVDFETAGEQELREAEYDVESLRLFIETRFDRKTGNRGKDKLVDLLLDCRFRELDINPNDAVTL